MPGIAACRADIKRNKLAGNSTLEQFLPPQSWMNGDDPLAWPVLQILNVLASLPVWGLCQEPRKGKAWIWVCQVYFPMWLVKGGKECMWLTGGVRLLAKKLCSTTYLVAPRSGAYVGNAMWTFQWSIPSVFLHGSWPHGPCLCACNDTVTQQRVGLVVWSAVPVMIGAAIRASRALLPVALNEQSLHLGNWGEQPPLPVSLVCSHPVYEVQSPTVCAGGIWLYGGREPCLFCSAVLPLAAHSPCPLPGWRVHHSCTSPVQQCSYC